MVGAVQKELADFSFDLMLTGQREEVIDFSVPYEGKALNPILPQVSDMTRWPSNILHISTPASTSVEKYFQTFSRVENMGPRGNHLFLLG